MRRIKRGIAAIAVGAGLVGCSTISPVATTGMVHYTYRAGAASQGFPRPPEEVQRAAVDAMADMSIHSVRSTPDEGGVSYHGTTADGQGATVSVKNRGSYASAIVRVGWFGNEQLSRAVLDRIGIRLGTLPPEAIPAEPPKAERAPIFSSRAVPDSVMINEVNEAAPRD